MLSHSHPLAFTGVVEGAAYESRHFRGLSPACPLQQGGPAELQASHEELWCSLLSESTPFSLHDMCHSNRAGLFFPVSTSSALDSLFSVPELAPSKALKLLAAEWGPPMSSGDLLWPLHKAYHSAGSLHAYSLISSTSVLPSHLPGVPLGWEVRLPETSRLQLHPDPFKADEVQQTCAGIFQVSEHHPLARLHPLFPSTFKTGTSAWKQGVL